MPSLIFLSGVAVLALTLKYVLGWRRAQFPELTFREYLDTIEGLQFVIGGVGLLLLVVGLTLTIAESRIYFAQTRLPSRDSQR